jgi:Flp pilus assembly protein TadD
VTRKRRRDQTAAHPWPSTPASRRAPFRVAATALALIAAGLLAYSNGLHAPFVFDDVNTVELNPYITKLWPLSEAVRAPVQSAVAGRPVVSLSLALSYAQGGRSPAVFRAWNIGILILSSLVLFGIVRRTLASRGDDPVSGWLSATAVALFWLVHPLQTEVVDYITQRTESLMGLFYLLTLYCAIRAADDADTSLAADDTDKADGRGTFRRRTRSAAWAAAAVLACAAGMGSKEAMVTAPLLVLLYDAVFAAGSVTVALRRRPGMYAGLAATWILLAVLNADGPRFRSAGFTAGISPWTYLPNQAVMIGTYLKLAIWPHPLVLDYGRTQPIAWTAALPSGVLVLGLLGAAIAAWMRGRRDLAYLGAWFFLTLAPSSSVVPIATEVGAERRVHLALAAVIAALVFGVRAAAARWPATSWGRRTPVAAGTIVMVGAALTAQTMARNREYLDPVGLWQGVLAHRPHGRAHYNLAIALRAAGRTDEAMAHYREAATGEPTAHYALGFELGRAGRFDEAERELAGYIAQLPDGELVPRASLLRGQALVNLGRPLDAERAFREALRMAPDNPDVRLALGDLLNAQGRAEEALPIYRAQLERTPNTPEALRGIGLALYATGRGAEAIPVFEQVVTLRPNDPDPLVNLGNALAGEGRLAEAAARFRAALKLAPSRANLMSALAVVLAASGEREESVALLAQARQLAPNDRDVQSDYAAALTYLRAPR